MKILHLLIFLFFVSILLYLGLAHGDATVSILNAGGSQISNETAKLQGR